MSSFPYKKILVVGATSGIGEGLAEKFISEGRHVIISGRRQENIDAFIKKHGSSKASGTAFDITNLSGIPAWAKSIQKEHPDLDCVILNSGIQRGFDFSKPETVDLSAVELEFTTNYLSYIHMAMSFLPILESQSQSSPAAIAFTTSGLALVPLLRCPNYCASKAALHHWILCLRQQLLDSGSKVKAIELLPPAVQTELHDAKHQPDIKDGKNIGIPLKEYVDSTWSQLSEGKEQVPVGMSAMGFKEGGFEDLRQKAFHGMTAAMKKGHGPPSKSD
jgi:short-subunit dehydrogenase involved in D-alanine esterification of teichoic acids